MRSRPIILY